MKWNYLASSYPMCGHHCLCWFRVPEIRISSRQCCRHISFGFAWRRSKRSVPSMHPIRFANRSFGKAGSENLSVENCPNMRWQIPDNSKTLHIFFVFLIIIFVLLVIRIECLIQMNKYAYWDVRHFLYHPMTFPDPSSSTV